VKIIPLNGNLYLLKGTVSVNSKFSTEELKTQYSADTVLRRDQEWFICSKILEAEFEDL
jgi:hypothetical protein